MSEKSRALQKIREAGRLLVSAASDIKKATDVKFELASLTSIVLENVATMLANIHVRIEKES